MTLGEIYTAVVQRMWGEAAPPTIADDLLQGSEGIIANIHRELQEGYNFWFMRTTSVLNTVAGQHGYNLPENYKSIISAQFKEDGEAWFRYPMTPLGVAEANNRFWQTDDRTEYPSHYEIVDNAIILYPAPEYDSRALHLVYWKYMDRPADAGFTAHEDELSVHGAELLIMRSIVEMADIMKEWDTAQRYETKAHRAMESLLARDRANRQYYIAEVLYKDF